MARLAIMGATGYVGMEIVRLMHHRKDIEITSVVSTSFTGKPFSEVYPTLRGIFDMPCDPMDLELLCEKADVFISALPHGVSGEIIPKLLARGKKVIDHSADFRFTSQAVYEATYKQPHPSPDYIAEAVYGLPELHREKIRSARLIGDPGCYPTCSILAIYPLLKNGIGEPDNIVINAISGISGAGRKTELPYAICEATENVKAYGIATHRHVPEIEQELSAVVGRDIIVSFTPHLAPMKRGMLATSHVKLTKVISAEELYTLYCDTYKNEPFVRILPPGTLPETRYVAGSNYIDISVNVDKRLNTAIVISALDNLGKGSASQAIQALNLMCGLDETAGLLSPGLYL